MDGIPGIGFRSTAGYLMYMHIVITEVKLQKDSARRGGVLRDVNVVEFLVGWPRR